MRITKINIPKIESISDGLEEIRMDRLEKIVLIAGKNGSGKTRILNKVFNTFNSKPNIQTLQRVDGNIENNKNNIKSHNDQILYYERQIITQAESHRQQTQDQINILKASITQFQKEIEDAEKQKAWNLIETDLKSEAYSYVRFVPKSLDLQDNTQYTKNQLSGIANMINNVGVDNLHQGTYAKIQYIQDRWFNATHQHSQVDAPDKERAISDYEKLKKIIYIFLNTEVTRNIDGDATLFNFPMAKANLSDGQKILLQFCLAIYSQEESLKNLILVLDEPENHLHPSVIIETIERIQECVTDGQIWIATHSIPLLAHFDTSQIWFVENGKIKHAGKTPEKVLKSLLGNDDEISKLQDFISLPAQFASSRYAYESLLEPAVVITNPEDPQSLQIRDELLKSSANGKLRILDYGAGKGRLISNITDLDEVAQHKLLGVIDYIAFDKYHSDKEECKASISKAFGNADKRYYNDFNALFSDYDKESFDIVIMCNVLHEIDPKDWLKLFDSNGEISSCLQKNGKLLLVEDHQIPTGEKAYQKGFLVLDTPHLKELFNIKEKDKDFSYDDKRNDGRLKAHLIPKRLLMNISTKSRTKAITSLSNSVREKILEIRDKEKNYANGKLHGFYTQQFANAQLNLAEFK